MSAKNSLPKWSSTILRQLVPNLGSILIMAAMLFVYDAQAAGLNAGASPRTISYQGTLSTTDGTPVNTNIGLTFRLYITQSGGTALWTETYSSVPVNNGLFHVQLGSITPIPSSVWNNTTVYLGVQVAGDSAELSPRELVGAVPYAMSSLQIADGSITNAKLADGAVTSDKIAITYWSKKITAPTDNDFFVTTVNKQMVDIPALSFSYTPVKNGVIFLNLSMTFRNSAGSRLYCNIGVNGEYISRGVTLTEPGVLENCATNVAYPVLANQSYQFTVTIYSADTGTTEVRPNAYTNLSAFYVATP